MPDDQRSAITQVTDVDDLFGTHRERTACLMCRHRSSSASEQGQVRPRRGTRRSWPAESLTQELGTELLGLSAVARAAQPQPLTGHRVGASPSVYRIDKASGRPTQSTCLSIGLAHGLTRDATPAGAGFESLAFHQ